MKVNQKGISMVTILVVVIIAGAILGGFFLLLNNERSKTRDAKRIADMVRVQAAFEFLYNDTASFELSAIGGCDQAESLVSQCNLSKYIPTITSIKDPGEYDYLVSTVPTEDDYAITFTLENTFDNFQSGQHTLSPAGIQ